MTLPWRNCYASTALVNEINALYPNRDKSSDGTIGDDAHESRTSDHNLTVKVGDLWVVRARDVDVDGVDHNALTAYLKALGAAKDPRLYPNGYVISDGRITNNDFSKWNTYYGPNQHDHHFHVSFTTVESGFDSTAGWGISSAGGSVDVGKTSTTSKSQKEDPVTNFDIERFSDSSFRGTIMAEVGPLSAVVDRAWVTFGCTYAPGGFAKVTVAALNDKGDVTLYKQFDVANNRRIPSVELPAGTVMSTVEGITSPGAVVSAALINKTK